MVEKCGFRQGRSCSDAIFTVQQVTEEKGTQLTATRIYRFKKAYDNANRDKLWKMKFQIIY